MSGSSRRIDVGSPSRTEPNRPLRVVAWGAYDRGKPRTRILLRGLREQGVTVVEIHRPLWNGLEDKTRARGLWRWLRTGARWLWGYPGLVMRYLRAPEHDAVLLLHPGHLDALVLWPWARLRRTRTILDVFLGLYDTVVEDRRLLAENRWPARVLRAFEALVARTADRLLLDTSAQADHFCALYGLPRSRAGVVPVGVEPDAFPPAGAPREANAGPGGAEVPTVLFYGQMIPLHGIETILRAALSPRGRSIHWHLVGRGQESWRLERARATGDAEHVVWTDWVEYRSLHSLIAEADVCLGIFGTSGKAARVIPNKVYQVLAVGRPLVTRDGPGIRELLAPGPGIRLVSAGNPEALLDGVLQLLEEAPERRRPAPMVPFDPESIGFTLRTEIEKCKGAKSPAPSGSAA